MQKQSAVPACAYAAGTSHIRLLETAMNLINHVSERIHQIHQHSKVEEVVHPPQVLLLYDEFHEFCKCPEIGHDAASRLASGFGW
jgi:hypothetical protein